MAARRRRFRRLAGQPERVENPRPLLRLGAFLTGRPGHAGSHAHGAGGSRRPRGRGRGAARQPARAWSWTRAAWRSPPSPWRWPPGPGPARKASGPCRSCIWPAPVWRSAPPRSAGPSWPRATVTCASRWSGCTRRSGTRRRWRSLLDPAATDAAKLADWRRLSAALAQALDRERSDERREAAVAAQGAGKAADLLAGRYHLTATNVPYLARGKQSEKLRAFMGKRYPAAKNDLATAFLERCLQLCTQGGTAALVLPQNWLFLTSYRKLREKLLQKGDVAFAGAVGTGRL